MLKRTQLLEGIAVLAVPPVAQKGATDCGQAVVNAVLRYYGRTPFGIPIGKAGAKLRDIESALRSAGLTTRLREGASVSELDQHDGPAVVLLQAWADKPGSYATTKNGHYVVMVGRDPYTYYFMDPMIPRVYAKLPRAEFLRRWHGADDRGQRAERQVIFIGGAHQPRVSLGVTQFIA